MQYKRAFFRFIYGSVYVILYLVLVGLLLITPGDAIERSLSNGQNYNVLIVTISYVVTVVIVVFVYVLRLYITKTAIAAIPKTWVPVDKGDVKDAVYRMIQGGLSRSAAIACAAQPREPTDLNDGHDGSDSGRAKARVDERLKRQKTAAEDMGALLTLKRPVWGEIEHCGWASPTLPDLRNVQYSSVLSELPNLIEAKALTMAPTEQQDPGEADGPVINPEAAELLQRPANMTMRQYIDHLGRVGVISMDDDTASQFLLQYEHARFSNRPLSNQQFRDLMHLFAEMLRGMRQLDLNVLDSLEDASYGWAASESDIDNDAPLDTNPPSPRSSISRVPTTSTHGSTRRRYAGTPSAHAWSFRTAPNTPGSKRTGMLSRKSSENSFAQTRRQYPVSQPSTSSLRSKAASAASNDWGSVIRLATREEAAEGQLPYILNLRPTVSN
jgi:hypothetical protein